MPNDMDGIWKDTRTFSTRAGSAQNVHLDASGKRYSAFRDVANPARLIFGHYHNPRSSDPAHDVGGFVEPLQASLSIGTDGSVHRLEESKNRACGPMASPIPEGVGAVVP
jgi:hypothetical protein